MSSLTNLFGPQGPQRFPVLPATDGRAGLDADGNGAIDEGDAFLSLEGGQGQEYVDFQDLRQVLQGRTGEVPAEAVVADLDKSYGGAGLTGMAVINGSMNFDMISEYRQKQTFQVEGNQVFYTLTPDEQARYAKAGEPVPEGEIRLVRDEHGVLRWETPEPPAPEPPAEGAVTEATLVERNGILHWLFPGEVPQAGDKIRGGADDFLK